MSQNIEEHYQKDVDGKPLNKFLYDKTSVKYVTLDGRKVIAHIAHGVEFYLGKDSLDCYVKKHYYNQKDYDYIELNQRIIFSILFDKDLNIVEVRQLPHKFLHKEDYYLKSATILSLILLCVPQCTLFLKIKKSYTNSVYGT